MKRSVQKILAETVHTQVAYMTRKFSTCFQIKFKFKLDHRHDLVYHAKYPRQLCNKNVLGEFGRRIDKKINDLNGRDRN